MKIAIVEDDINMRKSLETAFKDYDEFEVKTFKNAKDALLNLDDSFNLVVTDINMPKMDGLELIKELDNKYEVIVITGNATLNKAIESLRLGVKDFLTKPFEIDTLIKAIKRTQKVLKFTNTHKQKDTSNNKNNLFNVVSQALKRPLFIAQKASTSDISILLLGESGVGKEVFANYIHQNSKRKDKPFIAINMAAIPETLIESELFGFVKGAFTDARHDKKGKFEEADGGTLFLDEIAEMPYATQSKLLRALQEQEITKLGSNKPIKVDIRVISATNKDLEERVKQGLFREDLYYRINTIPINIPPLRERKEEILEIANSILEDVSKKYEMPLKEFSQEAKELLLSYEWPGNIRELKSVCERATILSETNIITKDDHFIKEREGKKNINNLEKELILEALNSTSSVDEAYKLIGFTKNNFMKKLEQYGLSHIIQKQKDNNEKI